MTFYKRLYTVFSELECFSSYCNKWPLKWTIPGATSCWQSSICIVKYVQSISNIYICNITIDISKKPFLTSAAETTLMVTQHIPDGQKLPNTIETGQSCIAQECRELATKNSQIITLFVQKVCKEPKLHCSCFYNDNICFLYEKCGFPAKIT